MASWLAGLVGASGSREQRQAKDLASELEQQARQLSEKQSSAAELLRRWLDQANEDAGGKSPTFALYEEVIGVIELQQLLSFREVLLRSRAFETLLESLARAPALAAALRRDWQVADTAGRRAATGSTPLTSLGTMLRDAAERLLLPGVLTLWPTLLDALLVGGGDDAGAVTGNVKDVLRWVSWARRVLSAVKRCWQREALPRFLGHLDRQLTDIAGKRPSAESTRRGSGSGGGDEDTSKTSERLLRGASGGSAVMSKTGIKVAVAKEQMKGRRAEADDLRLRTLLLCNAVARLQDVVAGSLGRVPKLQRLLEDMDEALAKLNGCAKALADEQDQVSTNSNQVCGELQKQIAGCQMTRGEFEQRAERLRMERSRLMTRLEEIDLGLQQLSNESAASMSQERHLHEQLRHTEALYEGKIAAIVAEQKARYEEKMRAVAYQECAHEALDVVQQDASTCSEELAEPLRRRRRELLRTLTQYTHAERMHLECAAECLALVERSDELFREAGTAAGDGWRSGKRLIARAEGLLGLSARSLGVPPLLLPGVDRTAAAAAAAVVSPKSPPPRGSLSAEPATVPALPEQFFGDRCAADRMCVDCEGLDAEWASISHGTYLCTECAGRHRGLGVHISFVRSITMDRWSDDQLMHMQLGGNTKFRRFIQSAAPPSPGGMGTPAPIEDYSTFYGSEVATAYRRQLGASCEVRRGNQDTLAPAEDSEVSALEQERAALEAAYGEVERRRAAVMVAGRQAGRPK